MSGMSSGRYIRLSSALAPSSGMHVVLFVWAFLATSMTLPLIVLTSLSLRIRR